MMRQTIFENSVFVFFFLKKSTSNHKFQDDDRKKYKHMEETVSFECCLKNLSVSLEGSLHSTL